MAGMSSNAEQVADSIEAVGDLLDDLTPAAKAAADEVLPVVVAQAPRLTGRLAASLRSVAVARGFSIESEERYAPIVHARRPWIADAIAAREQQITDTLGQYVDTVLART